MKKLICIVLTVLLIFSLTACAQNPAPSPSAPAAELSEADLVAAVKANLGVPDKAGITYEISEKYYWDAAERYYKNVTFYEYGGMVAGASVDPTSGELLRNIYDYTAPASTPLRDAFVRVLNGEQNFVIKSWSGSKVEQKTLKHFTFGTEYAATNVFVPAQYAHVDMDRDSACEMVVVDAKMDFFLILRYDEGQVRGYMVPYRGLMDLRVDGRFMGAEGAGITSIGCMIFSGADYTVTELAYRNDNDGVYRLDGAASDKASVEAYYGVWELLDEVNWTKMES